MAELSSDIVRIAGDTYPSKSIVSINGIPIDLTGWNVDVRYRKDNKEWIVNCVISDPLNGLVNIYPHGRKKEDIPQGSRLLPDDFVTAESREFWIEGNGGNATGAPEINQVWDEDEKSSKYPFYLVRYKEYEEGYLEEMTHTTGFIVLAPRWIS